MATSTSTSTSLVIASDHTYTCDQALYDAVLETESGKAYAEMHLEDETKRSAHIERLIAKYGEDYDHEMHKYGLFFVE